MAHTRKITIPRLLDGALAGAACVLTIMLNKPSDVDLFSKFYEFFTSCHLSNWTEKMGLDKKNGLLLQSPFKLFLFKTKLTHVLLKHVRKPSKNYFGSSFFNSATSFFISSGIDPSATSARLVARPMRAASSGWGTCAR